MAQNEVSSEMLEEVAQSGGLKRIVYTDAGAQVQDTPPESLERAENAAKREAAKVASVQSVFEKLKTEDSILVVPKEIELGDEIQTFFIRKLSYADGSRIDGKRYMRKANGQMEFSQTYAETVGLAWQLHECVMMDKNAGQTDERGLPLKPDWVRMFSLNDITGNGKGEGLMDNPNPAASELVYALAQAVWDVNPILNPLAQSGAMSQLGMI